MFSAATAKVVIHHLTKFHGNDPVIAELLVLSAGRVMNAAARRGENWQRLATDDDLHHITDWLKAAVINNDPWLNRKDEQSRPRKLMKFSTIDQITREANKAMLKSAQKVRNASLVEGDEELYAELKDGYYIVRLLTPKSLDRETAQMQHCIGNGAYDHDLSDPDVLFLSLRDAQGKPHVTSEIRDSVLFQLQGKQNELPIQKYLDVLIPWFAQQKYKSNPSVNKLGYVIDIHSNWHRIEELPDGLEVENDLNFWGTAITTLPEGLRVDGDLDISSTAITALPEGLRVGGNLFLERSLITELPKGLTVGGCLYLERSLIAELPEGLEVGGHLDISSTAITALPEGLRVDGNLDISSTAITALPEGLRVGGNLFLNDTPIITLPERLTVGGDLDVNSTAITTLPEGLTVGGDLYLERSLITELPKGLRVGGGLHLRGAAIIALPEGLRVGYLHLGGTAITALPEGLRVGGNLFLERSLITELPKGLRVGGGLHLKDTAITALPEGLRVGGNLDISSTAITTLPEGLRVDWNLDISSTAITTLPEGLTVGGSLNIRDTAIKSLPETIRDDQQVYYDGCFVSISALEFREINRLNTNMNPAVRQAISI